MQVALTARPRGILTATPQHAELKAHASARTLTTTNIERETHELKQLMQQHVGAYLTDDFEFFLQINPLAAAGRRRRPAGTGAAARNQQSAGIWLNQYDRPEPVLLSQSHKVASIQLHDLIAQLAAIKVSLDTLLLGRCSSSSSWGLV